MINLPVDRTVISLRTLSRLERLVFSISLDLQDNDFVVTKGFREVIKKLNHGGRHINIKGPKGVGKSLSLCAIAVLLKEIKHKFLIYSPMCDIKDLGYISYVKSLYIEFGK